MASKGQKFKKASPELKLKILKEYDDGLGSPRSLGKKHGISHNTIGGWIRKRRLGVDVAVGHHKGNSGRPKSKELTLEDYKERYEILKKYQAFLEARQGKK